MNENAFSSRNPHHVRMNGLKCFSSFLSTVTITVLSLVIVLTLSKVNILDIDYTVCFSLQNECMKLVQKDWGSVKKAFEIKAPFSNICRINTISSQVY